MSFWATVWLAVYLCSALMFAGTAIVIIIVGSRDLRDLLSKPK